MDALILLGSFALFCLMAMPVAYALGLAAVCAALWMDIPLEAISLKTSDGMDDFPLLAIPFFILAGAIMAEGGMAERIINLAKIFVGFIRGGLALVNIVASTMFGCLSGSSVADTASIGSVMIPQMVKSGYPRLFAVNVTISGSLQPLLLPPSHNMVIYSLAAGGSVSVAHLFMAGVIPGLLLGAALMLLCLYIARRDNFPKGETVSLRRAGRIAYEAVWGLVTVFIILGGILSGVFTPTEGASVGAIAMLAVGVGQRALGPREIVDAVRQTAETSGMIFMILLGAEVFGAFLALARLPGSVADLVAGLSLSPYAVLLAMLGIYIVLGAVMDELAMILLTLPVFFPIMAALDFGMSPDDAAIWFGILVLVVVGIGLTAPPIGLNVFVVSSVAREVPIVSIYKRVLPFIAADVLRLALLVAFPGLSLWLVRLLA